MTYILQRMTWIVAACLTMMIPVTVFANYDAGEIAIIEDTTGLILPAEGMCDNMLYAQGLCVNHAGIAFYATHPDNYDVLIFFTNKVLGALFDVKMGFPVQSSVAGIGLEPGLFNPSQVGSAGRLIQCLKMGSMHDMPDNPQDLYSIPKITGIELVAHEIGHQWMAWVMLDMNDGRGPIGILRGFENDAPNGHWSAWFNSGSVMYGGILTDNGDGTFTDCSGARKYGPLDQYLMGLRSAEEVGPLWYVNVDGSNEGSPSMPFVRDSCSSFSGTRVDFTIDDIIRANGARVPASSPCHLKVGFAIVHEPGLPPTPEQIAKIDRYRTQLEAWWPAGTDNRGSIDASLSGCGTGTAQCPGEVSSQCGALPDGDTDTVDAVDDEKADEDMPVNCTPGEKRCNGDRLVTCNDAGELWVLTEDCGFDGGSCESGACVYADGDEDVAADTVDDADKPESTDVTESTLCVPGALRCQGTAIEKCSADGSVWGIYTDCAPRTCSNGMCVDAGGDGDGEDISAKSSSGCATGSGMLLALALGLAALRRARKRR